MWHYTGTQRPDFADSPGPGQESVWDYPRPPATSRDRRTVEVLFEGIVLARTQRSIRVLETASPPTFYLPPDDVDFAQLIDVAGRSFCEWKGAAQYLGLKSHPQLPAIGWRYQTPTPTFATIAGWPSFYPGRIECRVDGERVQAQPGGFYGGWMTSDICGPVKGTPGTEHW